METQIHSRAPVQRGRLPRCIHLAGADGTGKTTQGKALLAWLQAQGVQARYVWLRFPRLLCTPFLAYARLRGFSHQETTPEGNLHGYWNFERSWVMQNLFPWALLLDTLLSGLTKLYLPLLRGETVLCDRFVVDILADWMVGQKDAQLDRRLPGRLFLALLPPGTRVLVLDLDSEKAVQRSPELRGDRSQPMRRAYYRDMAGRHGWPVISADQAKEAVTAQLIGAIAPAEEGGFVEARAA